MFQETPFKVNFNLISPQNFEPTHTMSSDPYTVSYALPMSEMYRTHHGAQKPMIKTIKIECKPL